MTTENAVRLLAGSLLLLSLALAHWLNSHWIWLSVFVGANLAQSAFTGFCPAEIIFRKMGLPGAPGCCALIGQKAEGKGQNPL